MYEFMNSVLRIIFSFVVIAVPVFSSKASETTHLWVYGNITNRVGIIGIKDGIGKYRTEIIYGYGVFDHVYLNVHIHTFVSLTCLLLVTLFLLVYWLGCFWNKQRKAGTH